MRRLRSTPRGDAAGGCGREKFTFRSRVCKLTLHIAEFVNAYKYSVILLHDRVVLVIGINKSRTPAHNRLDILQNFGVLMVDSGLTR